MLATVQSQVLYQIGILFTLERYISVWFLYRTWVRTLSMVMRRSSRPEVFCKKTLLKKKLLHRCFPVIFANFLRTLFLQNASDGCFWIRNYTIRYDSAYYTHVNTSSSWNLKVKSPKINRGTLFVTLLNSLKY